MGGTNFAFGTTSGIGVKTLGAFSRRRTSSRKSIQTCRTKMSWWHPSVTRMRKSFCRTNDLVAICGERSYAQKSHAAPIVVLVPGLVVNSASQNKGYKNH